MTELKEKFWIDIYVTEDGHAVEMPERQAAEKNVGIYRLFKIEKGKNIDSAFMKLGRKIVKTK